MGGVAVDLVGDRPAHRQVEGVRGQQGVVLVGRRLVAGQLPGQAVVRGEGVGERVEAQHVLLDPPRLHRHRTGVRVVRAALGRALLVQLAGGGLGVPGGDRLARVLRAGNARRPSRAAMPAERGGSGEKSCDDRAPSLDRVLS